MASSVPADVASPKPRRRGTPPGRARHHVDWAVHARTTILDAQRYTRFVTIMKRALLLAAVALILAVVAYSLQPRDVSHYAMTFERMGKVANDLAMIKPRLTGTDSDGNPFVVTAERAVQEPQNVRRAQLFNVEADLAGDKQAWYNMQASTGLLDSEAQRLWLNGKISLFSDSGYELHTDSAYVDLAPSCDAAGAAPRKPKARKPAGRCATTTIRGSHVVTGQGPLGTLRANRFRIEKATRRVFLDGRVQMVIYPSGAGKSPKRAKKA